MFVLKFLKILLCPPKEPKQRKQIIFIFKNKNSYIKSMIFIPKKNSLLVYLKTFLKIIFKIQWSEKKKISSSEFWNIEIDIGKFIFLNYCIIRT